MTSRNFFLLLALCLVLSCRDGLAQGNVQVWDARSPDAPAAADGSTTTELDPAATGSPDQGTDDIAELEKLRAKQAIDPTVKLGQEIDQNLIDLQGAFGKGATTADVLRDPKLRQSLIKAFEINPLAKMPPGEIREHLKKSHLGPLFKSYPQSLDFVTALMLDAKAMPQLVKILERSEDLRNCLIAALVMMVLVMFAKSKLIPKKMAWWKKFLASASLSLLLMCFSTGLLLVVFSDELGPTLRVAWETLF